MLACSLRALGVLVLLLLSALGSPRASAAVPLLRFPCSLPQGTLVTCVLSGQAFAPHERVSLIYRVGARTPGGGYNTIVYRRSAYTDARGSFSRPALRFVVNPSVLAYRVTVLARGARGDHTEIETSGTP